MSITDKLLPATKVPGVAFAVEQVAVILPTRWSLPVIERIEDYRHGYTEEVESRHARISGAAELATSIGYFTSVAIQDLLGTPGVLPRDLPSGAYVAAAVVGTLVIATDGIGRVASSYDEKVLPLGGGLRLSYNNFKSVLFPSNKHTNAQETE